MAAAVDIDTKELEFCIRGLLVSRPTVAKANWLQRECEEELGKPFPLRQLGVPTFLDYLKSIPNVVRLQPYNGYNPDVYPVASQASSHIDQLVSKQRVTRPRKRGVGRQSAYGSRAPIAPLRRRPSRVVSRSIPSVVRSNQLSYSIQSREFRSRSVLSSSSKNGIHARDLEQHMRSNYDERDLSRNGIQNVDSLLSQAEGIVEQSGSKVYPKFPSVSKNTGRSCENGIPAGYEDELDDFDDGSDFYEEDVEKDSEEEMSKKAIQLWTKALGVQEKHSSQSPPRREEETCAGNVREATHDDSYEDQMYGGLEDDSNISKTMINNFRKILNEYPDGIWASQLPALYYDQFGVPLDALELGYSSMIGLVSNLPNVFSFKRVGSHDWKVYDARYIAQESLDSHGNLSSDNGRFIPQTIIENIKKLLVNNTNGFKSIDLLKKYQETFRKSLDLESLGFKTLEEFLQILKNHITLKKGLNYYILLPKHTIVPYEAMEPPKPDERLNVPAEALCVPIPINVVRLGEEIPLQELPPVQDDPDPSKPLLELEVRVAEVISPVFFYMTLSSMYEELDSMMDDLHKFYEWEQENFQIPLPHFAVGLYCAAKYLNFWHRAKITRLKNNGDIEIEYIDYGTPQVVKNSELRYLSNEFTTLPAQAICAKLIGVRPVDDGATKFPTPVCEKFLELVRDKRLVAHVYAVGARERMQLELILFDVDGKEEIVINDYLIENGFASHINQIQEVSTGIDHVVQNLEENELISPQANGSQTSLPLSGSSLLPENGATSLPANTISFPASSVNLYSKISATLKLYLISKFPLRDSTKAQHNLSKYTANRSEENSKKGNDEKQSCDPSTLVRDGLANGLTSGLKNGLVNGLKSDLASGLKNGLTNGLKNGLTDGLRNGLTNASMIKHVTLATDGPKQDICDVSDSIDVNPILEKIKKKQLNCLFGPVKPIVTQDKSKLESTREESMNIVISLNSSVFLNGTLKTSLNANFSCNTPKSSLPEKLNTVEAVANNITANADNYQSLNGFDNPNNTKSERKLKLGEISDEVMVSEVSRVESHISISGINDKFADLSLNERKILNKFQSEEIDLKAISEKRKAHKLKNLFVKPILPK